MLGQAVVGGLDECSSFDIAGHETEDVPLGFKESEEFGDPLENATSKGGIAEIGLQFGKVGEVEFLFHRSVEGLLEMLKQSSYDPAIGAASEVQRRAFVSEDLACCLGKRSETGTPSINQGAVYVEKNEHRNTGGRILLLFAFFTILSLDVVKVDVVKVGVVKVGVVSVVKFVILGFILVDEFAVGEHEVTDALLGWNR